MNAKLNIKRSVAVVAASVAAITGLVTSAAQADVPGSGSHYLAVHVPAQIYTIGVVGGGVSACFNVTPNAWTKTTALVNDGAKVDVWGYTAKTCAARTTANQSYYDQRTVPSDSLAYFWFQLTDLRT